MTNIEKYQYLFEGYYQRDEKTRLQLEEFNKENGFNSLRGFYQDLEEIEKSYDLILPKTYKEFVESACAWGFCGENWSFTLYDTNRIKYHNNIANIRGNGSYNELYNLFVIGEDHGSYSYFCDPFNILGYGEESIWRVDRCTLEKKYFELLAYNFFEFVEKYCNKKEFVIAVPFRDVKPTLNDKRSFDQIVNQKIAAEPDLELKIEKQQKKIDEYMEIMKKNKKVKVLNCKRKDGLFERLS